MTTIAAILNIASTTLALIGAVVILYHVVFGAGLIIGGLAGFFIAEKFDKS